MSGDSDGWRRGQKGFASDESKFRKAVNHFVADEGDGGDATGYKRGAKGFATNENFGKGGDPNAKWNPKEYAKLVP